MRHDRLCYVARAFLLPYQLTRIGNLLRRQSQLTLNLDATRLSRLPARFRAFQKQRRELCRKYSRDCLLEKFGMYCSIYSDWTKGAILSRVEKQTPRRCWRCGVFSCPDIGQNDKGQKIRFS